MVPRPEVVLVSTPAAPRVLAPRVLPSVLRTTPTAPRRSRRLLIAVVLVTVVALAFRLARLRFGYAHPIADYDEGVYLGSALALTEGHLPYRDFVFVHPPLITVLLTPLALLAKVIGTAQALGLAKVATALAGAASVPLTARLLWHRGPVAVLLGAGIVAVQDDAVASSFAVLLEPWVVLLCLLGAVLVFDGDRLAGGRRLRWGGVVFGLACATKIWAFALVLAVVLVCLPGGRRALRFLAGVGLGFGVPVLPFALFAPGAFVHEVFVVQIFRSPVERTVNELRLLHLFSVSPPTVHLPDDSLDWLLRIAKFVAAGLVVVTLVTLRRARPLDRFALLAGVLVVGMLFVPGTFYWHYAAFATPFLALAAVLPLARLPRVPRRAWQLVLALCVTGLLFTVAHREHRDYHLHSENEAFDRLVPAGSCVLTTVSSATVANDRFLAPDCPPVVDSFGTALAYSDGRQPSPTPLYSARITRIWLQALRAADFLYVYDRDTITLPSDPALTRYLAREFRVVHAPDLDGVLYARR